VMNFFSLPFVCLFGEIDWREEETLTDDVD